MSVEKLIISENTTKVILATYICKSLPNPKRLLERFLMFKTKFQYQSSKA